MLRHAAGLLVCCTRQEDANLSARGTKKDPPSHFFGWWLIIMGNSLDDLR